MHAHESPWSCCESEFAKCARKTGKLDSRCCINANLTSVNLSLITIREVLSARRERKEDLPDGVDICAIIPSMDCLFLVPRSYESHTYLLSTPVRSVKLNGRTMRKVIASEVEQVLGKVDRLSSNAKALQKYVCKRMRVTDTVYEVRVSTSI